MVLCLLYGFIGLFSTSDTGEGTKIFIAMVTSYSLLSFRFLRRHMFENERLVVSKKRGEEKKNNVAVTKLQSFVYAFFDVVAIGMETGYCALRFDF